MSKWIPRLLMLVGLLLIFENAQGAPSASQLVRQSLKAPYAWDFSGRQVIIQWSPSGSSVSTTVDVSHRKSGSTLVRYLGTGGRQVLDDGRYIRQYEPKRNVLLVDPRPSTPNPDSLYRLLQRSHRMTLVGTDMVCGRKAYVVLIIPKVKGNPWRKCWIDMYTKYTLKNEQYGPDWPKGRPQSFMFWSSIRFKPVSVRDVKIDAPANVQVVMCPRGKTMVTLDQARRMLGFRILMPMNAPPGYVYDGAETVQLGDWKAIHVRFTNGLNAVSMFESAEPMRLPTQSQGTSNMLSWKEEGTYITLLGNINRSDLEAIKRHIGRDEERQMLAEIIHKTGVTQEVVMRLRNRGFGYQNIGIALIAAKQSGEDPLSLLKSNSAGYSWEELSQRHRFQLQSILKKLQS